MGTPHVLINNTFSCVPVMVKNRHTSPVIEKSFSKREWHYSIL